MFNQIWLRIVFFLAYINLSRSTINLIILYLTYIQHSQLPTYNHDQWYEVCQFFKKLIV